MRIITWDNGRFGDDGSAENKSICSSSDIWWQREAIFTLKSSVSMRR